MGLPSFGVGTLIVCFKGKPTGKPVAPFWGIQPQRRATLMGFRGRATALAHSRQSAAPQPGGRCLWKGGCGDFSFPRIRMLWLFQVTLHQFAAWISGLGFDAQFLLKPNEEIGKVAPNVQTAKSNPPIGGS